VKSWLIGKEPDAGKDSRPKGKGMREDEMVGWYHWLNGHEFEQAPGDSEGQGSLVCCSPWVHKELDTTWQPKGKSIYLANLSKSFLRGLPPLNFLWWEEERVMSTYTCGTDVKQRTCAGCHVLTLGRLISADETFFFFVQWGQRTANQQCPSSPAWRAARGHTGGEEGYSLQAGELPTQSFNQKMGLLWQYWGRFWTELCVFKVHILKS